MTRGNSASYGCFWSGFPKSGRDGALIYYRSVQSKGKSLSKGSGKLAIAGIPV
jgi:hypothetical protein